MSESVDPWAELDKITEQLLMATAPPTDHLLSRHDVELLRTSIRDAKGVVKQPNVLAFLEAQEKTLRNLAAGMKEAREIVTDLALVLKVAAKG